MRWLDAANVAGAATLPLAVLYLMQASPDEYLAVANADLEALQAEGCFVSWETQGTIVEEPVCGPISFDSVDDGYLCIADESSGSLKWMCA